MSRFTKHQQDTFRKAEITIYRNEEPIEVLIEATYTYATEASWEEPGESDDVEIIGAGADNGPVELTDEETKIAEAAIRRADDYWDGPE